jgi:hypothetical protein
MGNQGPVQYVIQPGDSLDAIASRFGLRSWRDIYDSPQNAGFKTKHPEASKIKPGESLWIPPRTPQNTAPVSWEALVMDSASGAFVPGITFNMKVPTAPKKVEEVNRDANVHGKLSLKNPEIIAGTVELLNLWDQTEKAIIRYAVPSGFQKLATGKHHIIPIVNQRRIVDAIASERSVIRRADWGSNTPSYWSMEQDWDYATVVLHHSGNRGEKNPAEIENKHMQERRWKDIGYHYLIDRSGVVYEGCYLSFKGSHVEKANSRKIGVLVMGDFEPQLLDRDDDIAAVQISATRDLILTLKRHFPIVNLGGHRDYKLSTECPGTILYKLIPDLRKKTGLGGP